ncbi:unnamed protein product [Acanthoscelides obtectus]|uniref:Reverse transcriptase domain-containing protein n=1 Tax=Acanthoscelides obtectus TaxID=200917 RepID=A0A9P0KIQ2_ACAOB|nr:unnamed protein product [Acanthoscelides obtectus]CAK1633427.1 Probable RNA-directed DNA polymerase from transposon BS [Acanthoscelides obtectus]
MKRWITREVVEATDRLRFYFEVKHKYPTEGNKEIYRDFKRQYNKILAKAKQNYNLTRLEESDNRNCLGHNKSNNRQFGFMKNKTTTDAILTLVNCIRQGFENKNKFLGLFTDLTAAFDWGTALKLMRSYLSDRFQVVCCNNRASEPMLAETGCLRFPCWGSTPLSHIVNDLPQAFKNEHGKEIILYADDATFGIAVERGVDAARMLGIILDRAKAWFVTNQLVLNEVKTETLCFETKPVSTVGEMTKTKFLGVVLDTSLLYNDHCADFHSYNTTHCNNLVLPTNRLGRTNSEDIKLYNALPDEATQKTSV